MGTSTETIVQVPQSQIQESIPEEAECSQVDDTESRKDFNPRERYFSWQNILSIICSLLVSSYFVFEPQITTVFWKLYAPEETNYYEVNLGSCKIPNLYDGQSELPFLWAAEESNADRDKDNLDFNCSSTDQFSIVQNGKLTLTSSKNNCCMRNVSRPKIFSSDLYVISPACQVFENEINTTGTEFVFVQCNSTTSKAIDLNVHATLPYKSPVVDKMSYWRYTVGESDEQPYNVITLAIGSTSRAQAYRSLPKTMAFLEENGFVTMKGYQMMEESEFGFTTLNMIPVLSDIPEPAKNITERYQYWDNYSMIWSKFNEANFVTMFMTDDSKRMLNQNFTKRTRNKLFRKQPTDYYLKPFLEMHVDGVDALLKMGQASKDYCIGKMTTPEYLLKHLYKFHDKFKSTPTFSYSHFSWPQSHHDLRSLTNLDKVYLTFFKDLFSLPRFLDNTAFVILSDEGSYPNQTYFTTEHGSQEALNPLLTIRLPDRLVQKHPNYLKNLQTNSHRIVSPLDVHKTLRVFSKIATPKLYFRNEVPNTGGRIGTNLFTMPIPYDRSCSQAFIPEKFCLCNRPIPENYNGRTIVSSDGSPEKYWHAAKSVFTSGN